MPNITNALIATITATSDADSTVAINRGTGNPAFDSTFSEFIQWRALAAGVNNFTGYGGSFNQLYIKNVDPAGNIIVAWTPGGMAAANVCTLYPGDQIILWQKPGGGAGTGVTVLSLTPNVVGVLAELFLGT